MREMIEAAAVLICSGITLLLAGGALLAFAFLLG